MYIVYIFICTYISDRVWGQAEEVVTLANLIEEIRKKNKEMFPGALETMLIELKKELATTVSHTTSMLDSRLVGSTDFHSSHLRGVPRQQKMLKGHPPRVIDHQVY